ncbi:MAG: hypothetical protein ABWK15_06010 [Dissulfuribacterales bacterium]
MSTLSTFDTTEKKPIPGLIPQKDGSVALTIECLNGCISPEQLTEIAHIARDAKAIIHLTMAQKVMLLGMSEEAGIKALQVLDEAGFSVRKARDLSQPRVCVGKPFCKLALQDTFSLGEYLYKELARTPIPPKLKVAVSGCPAACSWANCMDLGFVGIKSGYIVMIGGHGGAKPRAGVELCRITTHEEAAKILKKLAEIFSKEVKLKARVDKLIQKFGMDGLKQELGI